MCWSYIIRICHVRNTISFPLALSHWSCPESDLVFFSLLSTTRLPRDTIKSPSLNIPVAWCDFIQQQMYNGSLCWQITTLIDNLISFRGLSFNIRVIHHIHGNHISLRLMFRCVSHAHRGRGPKGRRTYYVWWRDILCRNYFLCGEHSLQGTLALRNICRQELWGWDTFLVW